MARSEIAERPPLTVALLATPDSTASTLFGLYDLLLGARRDWQQLLHRADVASPFLPLIVSRDGHSLRVYTISLSTLMPVWTTHRLPTW